MSRRILDRKKVALDLDRKKVTLGKKKLRLAKSGRKKPHFESLFDPSGIEDPLAGLDETKMEQAFESLMRDAEGMNEDDPRQMATLMRKFSDKTGISMGEQMEEALSRMEAGEDPDQIEQEMGDLLDSDDSFTLEAMKKKVKSGPRPPVHDEKLYEL